VKSKDGNVKARGFGTGTPVGKSAGVERTGGDWKKKP